MNLLKYKLSVFYTHCGVFIDFVYTVPDSQGHDIKLNSFKTSMALKFMTIL